MITEHIQKNSSLFVQEWREDEAPEAAILIQPYNGTITLQQGNDCINLNYHSIKEFIKALKQTAEHEPV